MGPAATADFQRELIQVTPAKVDQDRVKVPFFHNPDIPDRTAAIWSDGPDPLFALIAGADRLIRAAADFLTIPCVPTYRSFDARQASVTVPIRRMIREHEPRNGGRRESAEHPSLRRFGLLSTRGTLCSRMFAGTFEPPGLAISPASPTCSLRA